MIVQGELVCDGSHDDGGCTAEMCYRPACADNWLGRSDGRMGESGAGAHRASLGG